MLLLTAFASGCTQETHRSEITLPEQEKPPVAEKTITEPAKESIAPKYLNLSAQALFEGPLDTDCPEVQMEQIAAWPDEYPCYPDKVADASCEYAIN